MAALDVLTRQFLQAEVHLKGRSGDAFDVKDTWNQENLPGSDLKEVILENGGDFPQLPATGVAYPTKASFPILN